MADDVAQAALSHPDPRDQALGANRARRAPRRLRTAGRTRPDLQHRAAIRRAAIIEQLARLGYASKAFNYATVGLLAGAAALNEGGTVPDTRGYTANANGVVKGFVFVDNGIVLRDECKGPDQEAVPIHVTFVDYQLVDVFTVSYVQVQGRFSGPIEPD